MVASQQSKVVAAQEALRLRSAQVRDMEAMLLEQEWREKELGELLDLVSACLLGGGRVCAGVRYGVMIMLLLLAVVASVLR